MNLKQYIIILTCGTLLACSAWFMVLLNVDPVTAGPIAYFIFYATLLAGLGGMLATALTVLRAWRAPEGGAEAIVTTSLRQAVLLDGLVIVALGLLSQHVLKIWLIILLILCLAIVEFILTAWQHRSTPTE